MTAPRKPTPDLTLKGPSIPLDPHSFSCPRPKLFLHPGSATTSPTRLASHAAAQAPLAPASGLSLQFCFRPSALPTAGRPLPSPGPSSRSLAGSHLSKSSLTKKMPAASGNTERMCRPRG